METGKSMVEELRNMLGSVPEGVDKSEPEATGSEHGETDQVASELLQEIEDVVERDLEENPLVLDEDVEDDLFAHSMETEGVLDLEDEDGELDINVDEDALVGGNYAVELLSDIESVDSRKRRRSDEDFNMVEIDFDVKLARLDPRAVGVDEAAVPAVLLPDLPNDQQESDFSFQTVEG